MVPVALVPDSVLGESVENGLAVVKEDDDRGRDAGSGDHWLAKTYAGFIDSQPRQRAQ
jgi:hypothetical protein